MERKNMKNNCISIGTLILCSWGHHVDKSMFEDDSNNLPKWVGNWTETYLQVCPPAHTAHIKKNVDGQKCHSKEAYKSSQGWRRCPHFFSFKSTAEIMCRQASQDYHRAAGLTQQVSDPESTSPKYPSVKVVLCL